MTCFISGHHLFTWSHITNSATIWAGPSRTTWHASSLVVLVVLRCRYTFSAHTITMAAAVIPWSKVGLRTIVPSGKKGKRSVSPFRWRPRRNDNSVRGSLTRSLPRAGRGYWMRLWAMIKWFWITATTKARWPSNGHEDGRDAEEEMGNLVGGILPISPSIGICLNKTKPANHLHSQFAVNSSSSIIFSSLWALSIEILKIPFCDPFGDKEN